MIERWKALSAAQEVEDAAGIEPAGTGLHTVSGRHTQRVRMWERCRPRRRLSGCQKKHHGGMSWLAPAAGDEPAGSDCCLIGADHPRAYRSAASPDAPLPEHPRFEIQKEVLCAGCRHPAPRWILVILLFQRFNLHGNYFVILSTPPESKLYCCFSLRFKRQCRVVRSPLMRRTVSVISPVEPFLCPSISDRPHHSLPLRRSARRPSATPWQSLRSPPGRPARCEAAAAPPARSFHLR